VEHLGPYLIQQLLAERPLDRGQALSILEGRDLRTGMTVHIYRPLEGSPPRSLPRGFPWIDALEGAWIAERPFGALAARRYVGSVDPERVRSWGLALLGALEEAEARGIVHGALDLDWIWVQGEKLWIEGLGLPLARDHSDREGALAILQALAGPLWSELSWASAWEAWARGELESAELHQRMKGQASEAQEVETQVPEVQEVAAPQEVALETPLPEMPKEARPVQRIRIDEPLEPPFPILEPPPPARRRGLWGLWVIPLILAFGLWWWLHPRPSSSGYVVAFQVHPLGATAELRLLKAPPGSHMVPGHIIATIPGEVYFDVRGTYLLQILVSGQPRLVYPLQVPDPAGVRLQLTP